MQLVLTVVGSYFGPIGAMIGGAIGAMIDRPSVPTRYNIQPLIDLKIPGTEYGKTIPWARGSFRTGGDIWWSSDRQPLTTVVEEGGGKSGGGGGTINVTRTYSCDQLIGLHDGPIVGIRRIWENGKLIWTIADDASAESVAASIITDSWSELIVYKGTSTQLPDPVYEAAVGTENATAYRNRAYVAIHGRQLGQSGQISNLTFEVIVDGAEGGVPEPRTVDIAETFDNGLFAPNGYVDPNTGFIWRFRAGYFQSDCEVHVYSDRAQLEIATITSATIGGFTPSSITHVTIRDPLTGASTNEVWVLGTAGIFDTICFSRFTAGMTSAVGEIQEYPVFLGNYIPVDGLGNSIPTGYATAMIFDDVTGHVIVAGAFSALASCRVSSFDPGALSYLGHFFCTNSCGNPSSIIGKYPYFAVAGSNGSALNPNIIIIDAENATERSSTYIASWYALTYAPTRARWYTFANTTDTIYDFDKDCVVTPHVITLAADADTYPTPTLVGSYILFSTYLDKLLFSCRGGSPPSGDTIHLIDPDTWVTNYSLTYEVGSSGYLPPMMMPTRPAGAYIIAYDGDSPQHLKRFYVHSTLIASAPPTVAEVQAAICARAGMAVEQYDVTGIESITRRVPSLVWADVSSARSVSEILMGAYFYDATVSDKLYFRARGGSSVATIQFADLGAEDSDAAREPFPLTRINDIETPAQIAITYQNVNSDYNTDTQYSDRLISPTSGTTQTVSMPIGMTESDAKAVADTLIMDKTASFATSQISTLQEHAAIEPTDVITIIDEDASQYRMRVLRKTDNWPKLDFELVLDDATTLVDQGITSADYSGQTQVATPVDSEMALMDIPILRDADDDAGFYVAAKGDSASWPGAAILKSVDDVTYSRAVTIYDAATMGTTLTALTDWDGGRVFDESSSVTVLMDTASLSSTTREALLNNGTTNAMLIGSEIIQFRDVQIISSDVAMLTGLLRGARGTEWAMTGHARGERAVLLTAQTLRRVTMQLSDIGFSRYYKAVTVGRLATSAESRTFTDNAVGLKPFSPALVRADRSASGDITFYVERRSRYGVRAIGSAGIIVPLGESSEQYEIDVLDGGTVTRTISSSTSAATYTAAEQSADFGSAQSSVTVIAYQISNSVGRGYPTEATV